jgi:hypothetical protein
MLHAVLDMLACPDCPPSRLARARLMAEGLPVGALAAALPFTVAGAVVAWIARRADRDLREALDDREDRDLHDGREDRARRAGPEDVP